MINYLYFLKTVAAAIVEFERFPGREFRVYKVGIAADPSVRITQYDMPLEMEVIDTIEFPNANIATVAETYIKSLYFEYSLKKSERRRCEWLGLDTDQVEHILEVMQNIKEQKDRFIKDYELIRKGLRSDFMAIEQMLRSNQSISGYKYPHAIKRLKLFIPNDGQFPLL